MPKTIVLLMLVLLTSCSSQAPVSTAPPTGNMPMTEQEYKELQIKLLKSQNLPPEEYRARYKAIMG